MMKKVKTLLVSLTLLAAMVATGCGKKTETSTTGGGDDSKVDSSVVNVKPTALKITTAGGAETLTVGKTLQLTVEATPKNASAEVVWSYSSEGIVSVDETGLATGLRVGPVIVTATSKLDENVSAQLPLTVVEAVAVDPTSITLKAEGDKTTVEVGQTLTITATVAPEGCDQGLVWSSDHEDIATVSNTGIVNALKEGKAVITAKSKKAPTVTGSLEITVIPAEVHMDIEKWEKIPFSTHEQYISAEAKTDIKVQGTVTYLSVVDENNTVSYFLQNGKEGFFIQNQPITYGTMTVGKSYAVGGLKGFKGGVHNIYSVAYLQSLETVFAYETIDISNDASFVFEDQLAHLGARVILKDAVIANLPSPEKTNKAFNFDVKKDTKTIAVRVDPKMMSAEKFEAIATTVNGLYLNQTLTITGAMTSFRRGKAETQILVFDKAELEIKPLGDHDKAQLSVDNIALPFSVEPDVTELSLPVKASAFNDVSITWESDHADIITVDGIVNHPTKDTVVKLTATAKAGSEEAKKSFDVNVISADDSWLNEVAKLDFEDAKPADKNGCSATKPSYNNKSGDNTVELGGHKWLMFGSLIGGDERDRRNGNFSARLIKPSKDPESFVSLVDKNVKFSVVEFQVGIYGENKLGSWVQVSYSNGDDNFIALPEIYVINNFMLSRIRVVLPVEAGSNAQVKISMLPDHGQRVNIDDIRLLAPVEA